MGKTLSAKFTISHIGQMGKFERVEFTISHIGQIESNR